MNTVAAADALERRPRQPQRHRQQLVVQRALFFEPGEHRLAHLGQTAGRRTRC